MVLKRSCFHCALVRTPPQQALSARGKSARLNQDPKRLWEWLNSQSQVVETKAPICGLERLLSDFGCLWP